MSNWFYVWLGWGITAASLIAYTAWVLVRGRTLSRRLPPEDRRWM
jgi:heme exporter protein CcmD